MPRPRPPKTRLVPPSSLLARASAQQQGGQQRRNFVPPHHPHSAYHSSPHLNRPFLVRNLQLSPDLTLPVSPATLIILFFALYFIFTTIFHSSSAVASHILMDDPSPETKKKLEDIKKDIGNNPSKFAAAARKYSKCPSGKANGGSLGKFGRGSMVPPFDKVVFDEGTKVGTVVGPVRTNFGWHLILVTEREM